jgi:integrase/recombinase XerD
MLRQTSPKQMARKLARILRSERPDYGYLKKVFRDTRAILEIKPVKAEKRLPQLLTEKELISFYEAVWQARNRTHMVLIKLLIFTGLRNAELANIRLQDVDLDQCEIQVVHGNGSKDRRILFPTGFRGELAQYVRSAEDAGATCLFESNRLRAYSTRRIRQIIHEYAVSAGIRKRVYPHLFRHQIITFLTKKGIISPKLNFSAAIPRKRVLRSIETSRWQTFPPNTRRL